MQLVRQKSCPKSRKWVAAPCYQARAETYAIMRTYAPAPYKADRSECKMSCISRVKGYQLARDRVLLFMIFGIIFVLGGCSILSPRAEEVDYKMLEQTAAAHLTQTFEAMPTSTPTDTPVPTDTPAPTATDTPEPTATFEEMMTERIEVQDSSTPILPTATVYFPDKADFVSALPSPNQFGPNQHFYLTWQLKNIGTSNWSGKYSFHYSEGIQLADQDSYAISEVIEPGGILTITLPATAPDTEGTYKTTWVLVNPDGIPFYYLSYVTIVGDRTFITAAPELDPTVTPSSLSWMCSDAERSRIQGEGCRDYCLPETVVQMGLEGLACYADGERVSYGE